MLLAAALLAPAPAAALAHAEVSPKVSIAGELQLYSLAVPTEKDNARTTKIVLTLPKSFSIDSFVPSPGWQPVRPADRKGDSAVIQKVTWTGGHTPTARTRCSSSSPSRRRPAPTVHRPADATPTARSSTGRVPSPPTPPRRRSRSRRRPRAAHARRRRACEALGADDRRGDPRRARRCSAPGSRSPTPLRAERTAAGVRPSRWPRAPARGARRGSSPRWLSRPSRSPPPRPRMRTSSTPTRWPAGCSTRRPTQVALTYDEAVEPRFALISVTDASGQQQTTGAGPALAGQSRHADRAAATRIWRRAGTSSTGGRSRSTVTRSRARSRTRSGRTPGPRRSSRSRTCRPPR